MQGPVDVSGTSENVVSDRAMTLFNDTAEIYHRVFSIRFRKFPTNQGNTAKFTGEINEL